MNFCKNEEKRNNMCQHFAIAFYLWIFDMRSISYRCLTISFSLSLYRTRLKSSNTHILYIYHNNRSWQQIVFARFSSIHSTDLRRKKQLSLLLFHIYDCILIFQFSILLFLTLSYVRNVSNLEMGQSNLCLCLIVSFPFKFWKSIAKGNIENTRAERSQTCKDFRPKTRRNARNRRLRTSRTGEVWKTGIRKNQKGKKKRALSFHFLLLTKKSCLQCFSDENQFVKWNTTRKKIVHQKERRAIAMGTCFFLM